MRWLRPALGVVVSLGLLWLVFRATDLTTLVESIGHANYLVLLPAIPIYFVGVWIRSARWQLLLRPVAHVSVGKLLRATLIGFTVNNLMPVRLGEIVRAFLLTRWQGVPPAASLATILVERLFDGVTLCGVVALAWIWVPLHGWLATAAVLGGLAFAGASTLVLLAALWPNGLLAIVKVVARRLPDRPQRVLLALSATFLDGLAVLRQGRVLLLTCVMSVVAWLTEAMLYWLILIGFGVHLSPLAPVVGMAAANLGTMMPSLPGFVGTFHLPLQAVLIDLFGVEKNLATSYTIVVHASLILPVVLIGLVLLSREGLSLADVSRRAAGRQWGGKRSTESAPRAL